MAVPAAPAQRVSRRPLRLQQQSRGTHAPVETPEPVATPPRKPMVMARRLSVFQRKVEMGLSPTALEMVFEQMRVVSEGHLDGDDYAGSTMISIDLAQLAPRLSDDADASTAHRFAELAPDDARVRQRARAMAFAEARRIAGGTLIQPQIDLEIRARGSVVHFALNVEATLRR
jgi:hypothetical protein